MPVLARVIEAAGISTVLVTMMPYWSEKVGVPRTLLRLHAALAPITAAVLPLSKKLAEPARKLHRELRRGWNVFYDDAGNIGRRYRRQDEAGTPFCITYDFDSQEDGRVTVRERDSMAQERVALDAVAGYLRERVECCA